MGSKLALMIMAYKRPPLLKACLESIMEADKQHIGSIQISCDHHSIDMENRMRDVYESVASSMGVYTAFQQQPKRLGPANHLRRMISCDPSPGPFVVLEEDTIVSPDVFNYAYWALQQPCQFVNLGGLAMSSDPHVAYQDWLLRSPYGWAFTRHFWATVEPYWNGKIREPYGWDWQVNHLCYREGWTCITPAISRVYNTGREEGTYDTPENWDAERKDVVICHESTDNISNYVLVSNGARPAQTDWPQWVKKEMVL